MKRSFATAGAFAAGLAVLASGTPADAQSLTVLPVNITMAPGQMATTLTVINQGDSETSVQIRALAWAQADGTDTLTASDVVQASPPIATIPAGGTQVVRLVLRQPPQGSEGTYRILLDQIPPAAASGTVRIALRLSIPVFAQPAGRAVPDVKFRIENTGGQAVLVGVNEGSRHETLRGLGVAAAEGGAVTQLATGSPYILAGSTRRWPLAAPSGAAGYTGTVRVTAVGDAGPIDQPAPVGPGR